MVTRGASNRSGLGKGRSQRAAASDALHERIAVVDGPDGLQAKVLPTDQLAAINLRERYSNHFWCATKAGGCGAELTLKAGAVRAPYYSHYAQQGCPATLDPAALVAGYQHLALQGALSTWLAQLGWSVTIEHPVDGGRVDVRVVAGDRIHVLEVQRSALSSSEWRRRDNLYSRSASTVTWLWGVDRRDAEATRTVAVRDVAFMVDLDDQLDVRIGTLGATRGGDLTEWWTPLQKCRLDEAGIWTPLRDEAVAATRDWRVLEAQRRARARDAERRRVALEDEARRRAEEEERRRDAAAHQARQASEVRLRRMRAKYGPVPPRGNSHTLAHRRMMDGNLDAWAPAQGWDWLDGLPTELHESARHLARFVNVYEAGPVSDLAFADVPDPESLQEAALVRAGLVTLSANGKRWYRVRAS
ncbi:MAG: competence protein CoiA family protein [Nocardioides sp.]